MLPNSIKLNFPIDKQRLIEEYMSIFITKWYNQKPFSNKNLDFLAPTVYHEGDWGIISLRAQGGDITSTGPGGPGMSDYYYTSFIDHMPYTKAIIENLKTYVRTVRLSMTPPGIVINSHCDTFHHFKYGQIRLQLPLITNEDVCLTIDDEKCNWFPGELWYGDFSKPHSLKNLGKEPRVTLLIDAAINDNLLSLFPKEYHKKIMDTNPIYYPRPITDSKYDELKKYSCDFIIPAALIKGMFELDDGIPGEYAAQIRVVDNELIFFLNGKPIFKLVPFEENKFFLLGWVLERYFEFIMSDDNTLKYISLVLCSGKEKTVVNFNQVKNAY